MKIMKLEVYKSMPVKIDIDMEKALEFLLRLQYENHQKQFKIESSFVDWMDDNDLINKKGKV